MKISENNIVLNSSILQELSQAESLDSITSEQLDTVLSHEKITLYAGFDMTANSLHLGHLLIIRVLTRFLSQGHNVIIILGGFTSQVGDPTDKAESRKILTADLVDNHEKQIKTQLENIIDNFFKNCQNQKNTIGTLTFLNNKEWLTKINYQDFLLNYAVHISVNQIIKLETVEKRLSNNAHISLLEMNYMVLQAIDFLYLHKKYNCTLQIGGSDQWGNIIIGNQLIKKTTACETFGLTIPLLTMINGKKMGKTESGAIWLNSEMCHPYNFWQYIRNLPDENIKQIFKCLSPKNTGDVQSFIDNNEINNIKIQLANQLTQWIHGDAYLKVVKEEINRNFNFKKAIFNISEIKDSPLSTAITSINMQIQDVMILTGIATSKSDAKRKILDKSIKINGNTIQDVNFLINKSVFPQGVLCLDFGKKQRRYLYIN